MPDKIKDNREFNLSFCDKLQPFLDPLTQQFGIKTFGYRKFYPDGRSVGISSNHILANLTIEKFNNRIIPTYEKEVGLVLSGEKCHFFRVGKPDPTNLFFTTMYEIDVWNTLSFYRQSGDCVEGFYFASTRDNEAIVEEYFNNTRVFEMFSFYFKDKFNSIVNPKDLEILKTDTISHLTFAKKIPVDEPTAQDIRNFITSIPLQKFFLSVQGKEYCLSIQEFRCLSLLSRGKTTKEIGLALGLSSRTVEGYIENIKNKINITSRGQLIDLFLSNFKNNKEYVFPTDDIR
jgi:DNA-binding CsgD family transcriptional regulator